MWFKRVVAAVLAGGALALPGLLGSPTAPGDMPGERAVEIHVGR
ncbi:MULTISPECIES: hypothetical protein [unclassified Nocardia]|nr:MULTISPECIES: hypothetical protein [unclassified Nocardia]